MLVMLGNVAMLAGIVVAAIVLLILIQWLRKPERAKLIPESRFIVKADDSSVRVTDPSGQERHTSWSFIERLVIRTTDTGPFVPDVFWEIQPLEEPVFAFPGGATGENDFLGLAQAHLPNFKIDQVIEAMSSTSNREFVVWERDRHCSRCQHEVPLFPALSHAQRLELRRIIDSSGTISAIKRLRELSGCGLREAKLWAHHRGIAGQGHIALAPCPHCGEPLRSPTAMQCRFCKRDWHDPAHIRTLGNS